MATASVMTAPAMPKPTFKPIISNSTPVKRKHGHVEFEPQQHLAFEEPESVVMMKDIGYSENTGVSPVAVSQPFRLFTTEAVQKFRDEVLSEQVMQNCLYKSNLAACQLRGYATKYEILFISIDHSMLIPRRYAPFTYDAWHNKHLLSIVSKIAGVDLIPNMNLEIGHINISVKSDQETRQELATIERERQSFEADEGIAGCPFEDDKPVVGWHTDSYPFVCVTMLSDCTGMVGGETALRTSNGDVMKVRGPQMVYFDRLEMVSNLADSI